MKEDPNQMAFPGLEHLAHPGARFLARGGWFSHHEIPSKLVVDTTGQSVKSMRMNEIVAHHREDAPFWGWEGESGEHEHGVGSITWYQGKPPSDLRNAVTMIEVSDELKGRGIGRALGGVANSMTRRGAQPGMSRYRTYEGDEWAQRLARRGKVKIPKAK